MLIFNILGRLGFSIEVLHNCFLYDFNSFTGVISNSLVLSSNISTSVLAYGCEFSPDCSKLFGTENGLSSLFSALHQWDLCASSPNAIVASIQSNTFNASNKNLALQLAKNGSIYIAVPNSNSISVINSPNNLLPLSNIQQNAISLGNNKCVWGLPGYNNSLFKMNLSGFTYSNSSSPLCSNYTFYPPFSNLLCNAYNYTTMSWNFNDPISGLSNTSYQMNATHNFSGPGTYTVLLLLNSPCTTDKLKQIITVNSPSLTVAGNTTLCPFQNCTLTATGANSYTWQPGGQNYSIVVNPSVTSQYTVSGTSTVTGCVSTKTIAVTVNKCNQLPEDQNMNNSLHIYPNPAQDEICVNCTSDLPYQLTLLNQLGDFLYEGLEQTKEKTINIKNYPVGLYFIRIRTNDKIVYAKFIKQ